MSNKITVIKFHAPWCGPCKAMKPIWQELQNQYSGNSSIELLNIDVDVDTDLQEKYSVRAIPTIVYLKNGDESFRSNGMSSKKSIEEKIAELQST